VSFARFNKYLSCLPTVRPPFTVPRRCSLRLLADESSPRVILASCGTPAFYFWIAVHALVLSVGFAVTHPVTKLPRSVF